MDSLLTSTLLKVGAPAFGIAAVLVASKRRGIPWGEGLGLTRPKTIALLAWLGAWIAWIAVSEILIRAWGLEQAKAWPDYPLPIVVLRIMAIGMLGPLAEELITRGIFFHLLRRTVVGPLGAIAILSLAWSLAHVQYGAGTLALIFVDGLILGMARYKSGSLWVPVAMHVLGNLISIAQSLAA
jgi:membrane protease YdiL (CAAX protease family)